MGRNQHTKNSRFLTLNLCSQTATAEPTADIFIVNGTTGHDGGVTALVSLMGSHGLHFYKSERPERIQGSDGLIDRNDVVLIKINCQWDERGGTNTDLLKELIQMIVTHPDDFTGEIVVADNGQSVNNGGSLDWANNNADDQAQSVQDVVDFFSSTRKVSTSFWTDIRTVQVEEYTSGDLNDGYVVNDAVDPETGIQTSYPKFKTTFGTYISFKEGIWDPATKNYNRERLKVINVPVLKSHRIYGVTACIKNYMGVVSQPLTNAHHCVGQGGMGTEIADTRFPTLNILDAVWVNANPRGGPSTAYSAASRMNVIMASVDPVALDYWAAKHVLMQAATVKEGKDVSSMNPDSQLSGSFGDWLRSSMQELLRAGHQVVIDEDHMNVYVVNMPNPG